MDVQVFNRQQALAIQIHQVSPIVQAVLRGEGVSCDEMIVHFVQTEEICRLHEEYFDDPTTTDCISFPIDTPNSSEYCVLGEVFVCTDTAINYVQANDGDPYDEATLYVVHGLLHLLGYDDIEEEMRMEMRRAEERHMEYLRENKLCLKHDFETSAQES